MKGALEKANKISPTWDEELKKVEAKVDQNTQNLNYITLNKIGALQAQVNTLQNFIDKITAGAFSKSSEYATFKSMYLDN